MPFSRCAGVGTFLVLAALILVIFGQISQINQQVVPRQIRIASLNTAGLASAISAQVNLRNTSSRSTANDFQGIYSQSAGSSYVNKEGGSGDGIRANYQFGYYGYCATSSNSSTPDYCLSQKFGYRFNPATALLQDVPIRYRDQLNQTLGGAGTTFVQEAYLGRFTHPVSYLIFVSSILTLLTFLISVVSHHLAFLVASLLALLSALMMTVGLVTETIILARAINGANGGLIGMTSAVNGTTGVSLGLKLGYGNGLWITWAAAGSLFLAVLPLSCACITGRSGRTLKY